MTAEKKYYRGKGLPQSIEIDGETFTLGVLHASNHLPSYPYILVGSEAPFIPLISVEHLDFVPTEEAIGRARVAIASYRQSNGVYCKINDPSLDYEDREFTLAMVDPAKATIDEYCMFGIRHVVVESRIVDSQWYRFAVFDAHLCELLLALKAQHAKRDRMTTAERLVQKTATDIRL